MALACVGVVYLRAKCCFRYSEIVGGLCLIELCAVLFVYVTEDEQSFWWVYVILCQLVNILAVVPPLVALIILRRGIHAIVVALSRNALWVF